MLIAPYRARFEKAVKEISARVREPDKDVIAEALIDGLNFGEWPSFATEASIKAAAVLNLVEKYQLAESLQDRKARMFRVIVLCGPQGSGKSSTARALADLYAAAGKTFSVQSFAAPIREVVEEVISTVRTSIGARMNDAIIVPQSTYRALLQIVGVDLVRNIDPDAWLRCMRNVVTERMDAGDDGMIVDDGRFENEARGEEWLPENGVHFSSVFLACSKERREKRSGDRWGGADHSSEKAAEGLKDVCEFFVDTEKMRSPLETAAYLAARL